MAQAVRIRQSQPYRGVSKRNRVAMLSYLLFALSILFFVTSFFMTICGKPAEMLDGSTAPASGAAQNVSTQEATGILHVGGNDAKNDWRLLLVNRWNPVPQDYVPATVTLSNGLEVDERCYPDLQEMMDACRAEGLSPLICSAYRTQGFQEMLYQNEVEEWLNQGYSQNEAEKEAGCVVAVPGTSEHQIGLALDIVDEDNQLLDESQERTAVQKWLMEHSWEYGFILRYPNGKSDITGIIYEPWHYRYVGRENAEKIHTLGVCLEEYLGVS